MNTSKELNQKSTLNCEKIEVDDDMQIVVETNEPNLLSVFQSRETLQLI